MTASITKDYSQIDSVTVSDVPASDTRHYVMAGFTTNSVNPITFVRHGYVESDAAYSGTISMTSGSLTSGTLYRVAVGRTTITGVVSGRAEQLDAIVSLGYYTGGTTITFNANGGNGAPSAVTTYWAANSAMTKYYLNAIPSTTPTRSGYTFLGWADSNTATTAKYTAGQVTPTVASTTLYAVWKSTAPSTPPLRVKVGGVWKTATNVYVKVNGAWKKATAIKVKVSGTWKNAA